MKAGPNQLDTEIPGAAPRGPAWIDRRSMNALLALSGMVLVVGCTPSAMILATARNEYSILHGVSTRQNVEKYLGAALEEEKISPPVPLELFPFPRFSEGPNSRFTNHRSHYTPAEADRQIVATRCRYKAKGKIIPHGTAGDANTVTMMTFGLGEIIMLPMAISETRPDASIVNEFEVWYSTKGTVLAYHWTWRSEKDQTRSRSRAVQREELSPSRTADLGQTR